MTSKISTNNQLSLWSLMREDLRHRVWMTALSILGSFLACPVAFLFFNDLNNRRYMTPLISQWTKLQIAEARANDIAEYLIGGHLAAQMVILMLGAVIVAVFGFRYLYSRRMVDLCHSLPVTRGRLFFTYWLNGLLIWLVPFLAGNLCVYLIALAQIGEPSYFGFISAALAKLVPFCILCFLIVYNGCLVAVMVSGNITNALVNLLLYGLIVFTGNATFLLYMVRYFDTFVDRGELFLRPVIVALSPLASPVCLAAYFSNEKALSEWLPLLLLSAALMLVNFCLSFLLYGKRPSELAERGLEAKWFRIPMRLAVSFLSGLLLAYFFDIFDLLNDRHSAWCLFGAVFGNVFAFAIANIIYHGGFKYLFRHKIQLGIVLLATCGVIGAFRYDVFGYDSYVPDAADIRGCSIHSHALTSPSLRLHKEPNGAYYTSYDTMPSEEYLFTDAEGIHKLLETMVAPMPGRVDNTSDLTIRVDTSKGSYYRQYRIGNTPEHREVLRPLVENDEYRECYFPVSRDGWDLPVSIHINSLEGSAVSIEDSGRVRQLHEAYKKDLLRNYSIENASLQHAALSLRYQYGSYNNLSLDITEDYTSTIVLLKEWYPDFCWTGDDLVLEYLNLEIYTENNSPESLDKYFNQAQISADIPAASESVYLDAPTVSPRETFYQGKRLDDPDVLAALKPYLIFGNTKYFFDDRSYVYIGTGAVKREADDFDYSIPCHVEVGTLPGELIEKIAEILWSNNQ